MNTNNFSKQVTILYVFLLALILSGQLLASEMGLLEPLKPSETGGQVTLPLEEYQRLLQQASIQELSPPSAYAVGQSVLNVIFHQRENHVTATIHARVEVETFEEDWTLVALLGPGAALESAFIDAQILVVKQEHDLRRTAAFGRNQPLVASSGEWLLYPKSSHSGARI